MPCLLRWCPPADAITKGTRFLLAAPGLNQPGYADLLDVQNGCDLRLTFEQCAERCAGLASCRAFVTITESASSRTICGGGPACFLKSSLLNVSRSTRCSTCAIGYFSTATFSFPAVNGRLPAGYRLYTQRYTSSRVPYGQQCIAAWAGKVCQQDNPSVNATVWDDQSLQVFPQPYHSLQATCASGCLGLDGVRAIAHGNSEIQRWYYNAVASPTALTCGALM